MGHMAGVQGKVAEARARQIAERLVSKNPKEVEQAINVISADPQAMKALSSAYAATQTFLAHAGERATRASGGKVGSRDYPAKAASRMERAVKRAAAAISNESRPLMSAPDEAVAQALRIAARR